MLRLYRVRYGKKDTPINEREYQVNGSGAVGTFAEYEKIFPNEGFEIHDFDANDEPVVIEMPKKAQREREFKHVMSIVKKMQTTDRRRNTKGSGKQASWG